MTRTTIDELRPLVRPVPLVALALLAINDHVLKGSAVSGVVTGKLSDVAGLFLFPVLATAVTQALLTAAGRRSHRGVAASRWCLATAIGFVLLKIDPHVNALATRFWGANVLDVTDLVALPAIALAWWHLQRTAARESTGVAAAFGRVAVVAVAGGVCIATPASPRPPPRPFVAWTVTSDAGRELPGCGRARAWVSKSGKTGVGLTMVLENPDEAATCAVAIPSAALEVAGRRIDASVVDVNPPVGPAAVVALEPCRQAFVYFAFELDNEASWNRGERDARFRVAISTNGGDADWVIPAEHRKQTAEHGYWERSRRPVGNPCQAGEER